MIRRVKIELMKKGKELTFNQRVKILTKLGRYVFGNYLGE
jgi:hypothetical protein